MKKECIVTDLPNCCCECKFQHKVFKHPWNQNEYAKGSILDQMGFICLIPGDRGGTFIDREHSMCEEYTPKDK